MEYNERIEIIGERIRNTRIEKGISQEDLIIQLQEREDKSSIGKNSLIKLEDKRGATLSFRLKTLYAIGEVLQVDINHLLGEQEHKSLDRYDIAKYTGLTEKAVEKLTDPITRRGSYPIQPFLNAIIESPYLTRMAQEFNNLIDYKSAYNKQGYYNELLSMATMPDDDKGFIIDIEALKSADYDRIKYAEYLLYQTITKFVLSISEGDRYGKEES